MAAARGAGALVAGGGEAEVLGVADHLDVAAERREERARCRRSTRCRRGSPRRSRRAVTSASFTRHCSVSSTRLKSGMTIEQSNGRGGGRAPWAAGGAARRRRASRRSARKRSRACDDVGTPGDVGGGALVDDLGGAQKVGLHAARHRRAVEAMRELGRDGRGRAGTESAPTCRSQSSQSSCEVSDSSKPPTASTQARSCITQSTGNWLLTSRRRAVEVVGVGPVARDGRRSGRRA